MSTPAERLLDQIQSRRARVGVIGLGYVGLPLAVEFARSGFVTTGIDLDGRKVDAIRQGTSYIPDVTASELAQLVTAGQLQATTDFSVVARARHHQHLRADAAAEDERPGHVVHRVGGRGDRGAPPPGHAGRFSSRRRIPARPKNWSGRCSRRPASGRASISSWRFRPSASIPGNPTFNTHNVPKVVGGVNAACRPRWPRRSTAQAIETVVPVSSHAGGRDGEAAREHVPRRQYRPGERDRADVRPARASTCGRWSTPRPPSRSASCRSIPGPGLGGHCIPIDPFYLSWKAKQTGFDPRFIELAGQINASMPHFVVDKIVDALNRHQQAAQRRRRVLVLGLAYKRDIDDIRESPSLDVMTLLHQKGATVRYADPYVPTLAGARLARRLRRSHAAPIDAGVTGRRRLRRDPDRHIGGRLRDGGAVGAAHRRHA